MTTRDTASALEVSLRAVADLAHAGLLPQPLRVGRQALYPGESVRELASWPDVRAPLPRGYVVRVRGPVENPPENRLEDERLWWGFTTGSYSDELTPEENEAARRDAVRGWWQVRNPGQFDGCPLIATLASFVVAVYKIEKPDGRAFGKVRFEVADPSASLRKTFMRHRLRLPSGPASLPIGLE